MGHFENIITLTAPSSGPLPSYTDTPHPFWGGEIPALKHRFAAGNAGENLTAVTQQNKNSTCQIFLFKKESLHIQEQTVVLLKPLHPKAHSQPSKC